MSDDITKKTRPGIHVDHDTGLIHIPGKDPLPLVTDLSKSEQREADSLQARRNKIMLDNMRKFWQCPHCRQITEGIHARVAWNTIEGVRSEYLHCPHPSIDNPKERCMYPLFPLEEKRA